MFLRFYYLKPRCDQSNTKESPLIAAIKSINNTSHNGMILTSEASKKFIVLLSLTVNHKMLVGTILVSLFCSWGS